MIITNTELWRIKMAKSNRKFHKTTITIVVLSEDPYTVHSLASVSNDIVGGDCSGVYTVTGTEELDGKEMALELKNQYSDPSFFRLTENGEDEE